MEHLHHLLAMGLAQFLFCFLKLSPEAYAEFQSTRTREYRDLTSDGPHVNRAVQMSVARYNKGSSSLYNFRDVSIIKAQRQVTAGIKLYLTLEMENTECKKTRASGDHMHLTTCPQATGVQREVTALPFESEALSLFAQAKA